MGDCSAMSSITRVIEKHGDEIEKEIRLKLPRCIQKKVDINLENNIYAINISITFRNGETLDLLPLDIDTLADRFPDCEVGY